MATVVAESIRPGRGASLAAAASLVKAISALFEVEVGVGVGVELAVEVEVSGSEGVTA